jgi:hypothetical protein
MEGNIPDLDKQRLEVVRLTIFLRIAGFTTTAHAQAAPAWAAKPPIDPGVFASVGRAQSRSLEDAKAQALTNAATQIAQRLAQQKGLQGKRAGPAALADYAKAKGEQTNSYFSYDNKSGAYTYFVELRLSPSYASDLAFQAFWTPADRARPKLERSGGTR